MIRKLPHIKSFGVFSDFLWPASLPDFKQFNLIYGWNYSGKTTLSRVFRCFEQKQPHPDFAGAQAQMTMADGTTHHLAAPQNAPALRVFNSDFVRENLRFDSAQATPILVLGVEDITKQELLTKQRQDRATLLADKLQNEARRDQKQNALDQALTKDARDLIKNALAVPNYDKRDFTPKVNQCAKEPEGYLLDDAALAQCLSVYRSTDKKAALSARAATLSSVAEAKNGVDALLARVVTANRPIARLKDDSAVEAWVKEGRPLHDGKTACQFCGQPLPPDLLTHLAEHFSADYEDLMADLQAIAETLTASQGEEIALDDKANFYPELQDRFTAEKGKLEKLLKTRKSALGTLAKAVTKKQTNAFTQLACPAIDDPSDAILSPVEAINKIIAEHNARTEEFDKNRMAAFDKLELHYAASFARDQKYNETLNDIGSLSRAVAEESKTLGELDGTIRGLEKELSEASKGAERINELLVAYFGKNDLLVEVSADKAFQIVRGGVIAKNLSEGEKTAIAFAYFITLVQDGRHPLADTRVVIDDPISSLDTNHLFNTYALIKTQLSGCRQLFIATHSFELYNLVREWVGDDEKSGYAEKPQASWRKWGVFLVKRADNGKATLEIIPKELLKFKSEYHYLFSTLYHFDKAGAGDFDCLLSLPNVVRRFMEAFGGIMIPLYTGLHGKMERLFPDPIERERVWKFINHYSHNTTITRSLTIPDTSECKDVVKACLKAVRNWNLAYFADLETEVK